MLSNFKECVDDLFLGPCFSFKRLSVKHDHIFIPLKTAANNVNCHTEEKKSPIVWHESQMVLFLANKVWCIKLYKSVKKHKPFVLIDEII